VLLGTHLLAAECWCQHVGPAVLQMKVEVVEVLKELSKVRTQDLQQTSVTLQTKERSSK
jgi:hypothetical protein